VSLELDIEISRVIFDFLIKLKKEKKIFVKKVEGLEIIYQPKDQKTGNLIEFLILYKDDILNDPIKAKNLGIDISEIRTMCDEPSSVLIAKCIYDKKNGSITSTYINSKFNNLNRKSN
jgi:hypothetical protein